MHCEAGLGLKRKKNRMRKKDIAADYFCFSNHPFTANSIDSDSMALSVFLTLRLYNSLFLCPPGPKRNDSSALSLSIKEPLTGNHSSWSPSLAFNFYKTYQSWQRGGKSGQYFQAAIKRYHLTTYINLQNVIRCPHHTVDSVLAY